MRKLLKDYEPSSSSSYDGVEDIMAERYGLAPKLVKVEVDIPTDKLMEVERGVEVPQLLEAMDEVVEGTEME